MFDWHTILWTSPTGSEGDESYQAKDYALEAARKLMEQGYVIRALQHGGRTVMNSQELKRLFRAPRSN